MDHEDGALGIDFDNHHYQCIIGNGAISIISVELEMTVYKTVASPEKIQYFYKFYKRHISSKTQSEYLRQTT